jgi:site-specific DNA recombinase
MIVSKNRNRYGTLYSYFVCLGRHQKRTDCKSTYLPIEIVEQAVIDFYGSVELAPGERDAIALRVGLDFEAFRREIEIERTALEKRQRRLLRERQRVLQAHYADAVPLDLLRSEQARIARELDDIAARLGVTDRHEEIINFNLERTLLLATNVQAVYEDSDPKDRRLLNQAFFKRICVREDRDVTAELAEPYDMLLSPTLRARAAGLVVDDDPERDGVADERAPRRAKARRGSNNETMVGAGGFEPP